MTRGQLRNSTLFALTLALGVALSTRDAWSLNYLRYATYFTCLGATFVWLVRFHAFVRVRCASEAPSWRSPAAWAAANAWEIGLAGLAMGAIFATHDFAFKVLSDETNIVATARSLSSEWRFDFPTESSLLHGATRGAEYVFDKRPPLFSFWLSLVDSITGYRVANVWFLNGAILGATVFVTASVLRRRLGRPWNLFAVVWGLANPVVMMTGRAAGVEPTVCLVWAVAGALALEVAEGGEDTTFELMLATIFLLGLARIEAGPLGVVLLGISIAVSPARPRLLEKLREEWLLWLAPIIAMPAIIQRARVKDYFQGTTEKPFALEHVVDNVHNWRTVFADGGRYYPFNAVILAIEIVAVVALVVIVARGRTSLSRGERAAFLAFTALTAALVALYSVYYWGQPTRATSARFYALPLFFAGLTVVPFARRLAFLEERPWLVGIASVLAFAFAFPAASNRAFQDSMPWRREHEFVTEHVLPEAREKRVLLVSPLPAQFTIYDLGSVGFTSFKTQRAALERELNRNRYDEILVLQEITLKDRAPTEKTALDPSVQLEPIVERAHSGTEGLRLSRLRASPPKNAPQNGMSSSPPPPAPPPP